MLIWDTCLWQSKLIVGFLNITTVNESYCEITHVSAEVGPIVSVRASCWIEEKNSILDICVDKAKIEQNIPGNDIASELSVVLSSFHWVGYCVEAIE